MLGVGCLPGIMRCELQQIVRDWLVEGACVRHLVVVGLWS